MARKTPIQWKDESREDYRERLVAALNRLRKIPLPLYYNPTEKPEDKTVSSFKYYMRRGDTYYFRNSFGKLVVSGFAYDNSNPLNILKYGETYQFKSEGFSHGCIEFNKPFDAPPETITLID